MRVAPSLVGAIGMSAECCQCSSFASVVSVRRREDDHRKSSSPRSSPLRRRWRVKSRSFARDSMYQCFSLPPPAEGSALPGNAVLRRGFGGCRRTIATVPTERRRLAPGRLSGGGLQPMPPIVIRHRRPFPPHRTQRTTIGVTVVHRSGGRTSTSPPQGMLPGS